MRLEQNNPPNSWEEMGLVEQDEDGGRMITKEGQRELDTVAVQAAAEEEEQDLRYPGFAVRRTASTRLHFPSYQHRPLSLKFQVQWS